MKKIIMTFAAIILSLGIGLCVPTLFTSPTQGIEVDREMLYVGIQQQFVEDLLEAHSEQVDITHTTEQEKDIKVQQAVETASTNSEYSEAIDVENTVIDITPDTKAIKATEVVEPPTIEDVPKSANEPQDATSVQIVKDTWVQEQINENRDQINDADLFAGASIYNTLDTNYLFGLAEDGLTEEEKIEVQAYLEANLSPDEIGLAMELYNKYVQLLN